MPIAGTVQGASRVASEPARTNRDCTTWIVLFLMRLPIAVGSTMLCEIYSYSRLAERTQQRCWRVPIRRAHRHTTELWRDMALLKREFKILCMTTGVTIFNFPPWLWDAQKVSARSDFSFEQHVCSRALRTSHTNNIIEEATTENPMGFCSNHAMNVLMCVSHSLLFQEESERI